jgi:acyl-coenzyme A thioesterase PaaI-like protein
MVTMLKRWWARLSPLPLGKWIFSKFISRLIPYTGTISPFVREVGPGFAEVSIKDCRRNRNHLRSIHAVAIANLGEFTTGLALHFALDAHGRAILTRLETEYHKKARGEIVASARLAQLPINQGLNIVTAVVSDKSNSTVATVKAFWLVDRKDLGTP